MPKKRSPSQSARSDASRKRKPEPTAREGEESFRGTFLVSPIGMAVTDLADHFGRFLNVNRAFCAMLGYTEEELAGLTFTDVTHPDDIGESRRLSQGLLDGTVPSFRLEKRYVTKQGTTIWAATTVTLIHDKETGKARGMAMVEDVTERRRAEQALREGEARYRELFENSGSCVAVYEATPDGDDFIIRGFNRAAERAEKVQRADIAGRKVTEVFPGVKEFGLFDVFRRVWRTGAPERHPVSLYTDERIAGWRENYVYKLPSGEVVAVYEDVTERKQAEQALRAERDRAQLYLDTVGSMVVALDASGRITLANRMACEVLGYEESELLGRDWFATCVPEARRKEAEGVLSWHLAGAGKQVEHYELPVLTRDGKERLVLWYNVLLRDSQGQPAGMLSAGVDITERKQTERALYEAGRELERHRDHLQDLVEERTQELRAAQNRLVLQEKLATLGRVAGSVAHELRNPLGAIRNASYYLQKTAADKLEGKAARHLEIIDEYVERANRAITMILDFTWQQPAEPKLCALRPILDRAIADVTIPADVKTLLDVPAGLPRVLVDDRQMVAVFRNLLTNAAQAMPAGGTARIGARRRGPSVVVTVADTGTGIKPEHLGRLFEPLFTTRDIGVGLGLAICKGFVEANKGTMSVESEYGKGTTFTVTLPSAEKSQAPSTKSQTNPNEPN